MFNTRRYFVSPLSLLIAIIPCTITNAAVVTTEFSVFPEVVGWEHTCIWCTPERFIEDSVLRQELRIDGCKPAGEGDKSTYRRTIDEFNGAPNWFLEFRIESTGEREMIPFGAPSVLAAANSFGLDYTATVASDQLKLFRDAALPIAFIDVESGVAHTIRLELTEFPSPNYRWFVDGTIVDQGEAEGSFPADNSTITWRGRAFGADTTNRWHYIRYGDIPIDASGDFDSDGEVDGFEVFYFDECLSESGAGVDAGPGCRWADMDGDTDVDCDDYDLFADAWTAPVDPPTIGPCAVGQTIPAASSWGVLIMAALILIGATLIMRKRRYLITLLAFLAMLIPIAGVRADVVTLEFTDLPDAADWDHSTWCTPSQEILNETLFQNLEIVGCRPEGDGDSSTYLRTIHEFNSSSNWFYEFEVATTGDRDMISFSAPVALSAFNSTGLLYHVTVARDQVRLLRDVALPILFFDLIPAQPHKIRLELRGGTGSEYLWYVDNILVDSGPAEGPFPIDNSRITWRGKAVDGPTDNTWHYIRYGDIPIDASGDFDSDGEVDGFEVFYFDECLSESGAGVDAGPGCRWADMDSDTDVDCDDYDLFADAWTAPGNPPTIGPCAFGQTIPAASNWGVMIMAALILIGATLIIRKRRYFVAPLSLLIAIIPCTITNAAVVTTEFSAFPETEGWERSTWCTPERSLAGNVFGQDLGVDGCVPMGDGDQDIYTRTVDEFNDGETWFFEFRVAPTGDESMIPFGAPAILSSFNSSGITYNATISNTRIKLLRDVEMPILFFDVEPGVAHTIRVELLNNPSPKYIWYIDNEVVDQGDAEGGYPSADSQMTWRGRAFESGTLNHWHYIRYGDIPVDASGDFNSDGEVDDFEVFYFDECLSETGEGVDAGPGCRWADMDGDTDVDCDDYDLFADAWTAPGDPPPIAPCASGQTIPAASEWGVAVLALLTLTTGTLAFRRTTIVP